MVQGEPCLTQVSQHTVVVVEPRREWGGLQYSAAGVVVGPPLAERLLEAVPEVWAVLHLAQAPEQYLRVGVVVRKPAHHQALVPTVNALSGG